MIFEPIIESEFNIGDKVVWEGWGNKGVVVLIKLNDIGETFYSYEVMYLIEMEDLTRQWKKESELFTPIDENLPID